MRDLSRRLATILCAVAALPAFAVLLPCPAQAQGAQEQALEQEGLAAPPAPGTWSVTLGAGIADVPRYPGADSDRARLVPLVEIRYGGRLFLGPFGLGVNAIDWNGFRAGPVLGFEGGRQESDDPHLAGLGDISPSITGGLFAAYRIGPFDILGTVRQAINHTDYGLGGLAELDYRHALLRDSLYLRIGPQVEFADARHEQTWFGVTASQSAVSGLEPYTPAGGVSSVGAHASLTFRASEHVLWRFFADARRLSRDAADSPVVERRTDGLAGLGFAYRF